MYETASISYVQEEKNYPERWSEIEPNPLSEQASVPSTDKFSLQEKCSLKSEGRQMFSEMVSCNLYRGLEIECMYDNNQVKLEFVLP